MILSLTRRLVAPLILAGVAAALVLASASAAGVTGPAFYVDGELYRTVGTPALLPDAAPDHSFDVIYDIAEQTNVAEAAPGDTDFNGGRWQVHSLTFTDYAAALAMYDANGSGDFDSVEEIHAAIAGGLAIDNGVVISFECPVIPLPAGQQ